MIDEVPTISYLLWAYIRMHEPHWCSKNQRPFDMQMAHARFSHRCLGMITTIQSWETGLRLFKVTREPSIEHKMGRLILSLLADCKGNLCNCHHKSNIQINPDAIEQKEKNIPMYVLDGTFSHC